MSREQNELRREIEEGLDETRRCREWAMEEVVLPDEGEDWLDEDDWEEDDWDEDWDEDDDDDDELAEDRDGEDDDYWDDFLPEEPSLLLFAGCLYPVEDVQRARELLWGEGAI